MTNLQGSAPNPLIPRLLQWVPVGVGGLVSLAVLALATGPLFSQLQLQGRQIEEKRAQEERLPQLRLGLRRTANDQLVAEGQQQRLLQLIAGSGELMTFMAQVDREARRHGVELQLYEPTHSAAAATTTDPLQAQAKGTRQRQEQQAAAAKEAEAAKQSNPLLRAGLKKSELLLKAQGSYVELLAFLRALESLSLLVVQSNLAINQTKMTPPKGPDDKPAVAFNAPLELKLAVSLYSSTTKD